MKYRSSLLLSLGICTLIQGIFLYPTIAQEIPDGIAKTTGDISGANITIRDGEGVQVNRMNFSEILVDEQATLFSFQTDYSNIRPIETNAGKLYPARGIIKTEDGKIILTGYRTDNINIRTPHNSANCIFGK